LGLWSARALVKRGLLVEAAERYLETTGLQVPSGDAAVQRKAIEDARAELEALKPRIPSLRIGLVGAQLSEVQVSIDGKTVASALLDSPRLVNPGAHEVVATRGAERAAAQETVSEGQQREVTLRFSSAASTAPAGSAPASEASTQASSTPSSPAVSSQSPRRTIAVVALAAGGAGLVLGGVAGVLALNKKKELDDTGKCSDGCPSSLAGDVDQLHLYRPLSTAGFIAGGVLAGLGVVLWVTAPSAHGSETRAVLGPSGLQVSGRF
jgi:hypothetical protein